VRGQTWLADQGYKPEVWDRFWAKVTKTENCWIWTGAVAGSKISYGYFKPGYIVRGTPRRPVYVHRFAHEMLIGPIPEGYEVDHVVERGCTSELCVNPAHLEAVTPEENKARRRPRGARLDAA